MAKRDPRRFVTPDAFTMSTDLVGVALARPSRRLIAIALDGLCIAILSRIGGKMLLALLASIMLWRAGNKPSGEPGERVEDRRVMRTALRFASVFAVFLFSIAAWKFVSGHMPHPEQKRASNSAPAKRDSTAARDSVDPEDAPANTGNGITLDTPDGKINIAHLGLGLGDTYILPVIGRIDDAKDSAAAAPAADSIARWLQTKPDSARGRIARLLYSGFDNSPGGAALYASLHEYLPEEPADSMARRVLHLNRQIHSLNKQIDTLQVQVQADKPLTISKMLKTLSDFLGFGFGWGAVYFATFTTLMRGQTPGKRLLGIRVVRLDGEPLTGWMSFERFGGYAASAATGLLGFAQIFWDRNRQALHDKVAETVVIRVVNGEPVRSPEAAAYAAAARRRV